MNSESNQSNYNILCNVFKRAFIVICCEYGNLFFLPTPQKSVLQHIKTLWLAVFFQLQGLFLKQGFLCMILFTTRSNQRVLYSAPSVMKEAPFVLWEEAIARLRFLPNSPVAALQIRPPLLLPILT